MTMTMTHLSRNTILVLLITLLALNTNYAQVIQSFSDIELAPVSKNYQIMTTEKTTWNARITIPKMDSSNPNQTYPLVIGLHWLANNKEDQARSYINYSECLAEPIFNELNAFIISPQAEDKLWHSENNQVRVLTLIEQAKKHWPIDENKIVITGYSQGGVGTWFYVDKYPEIFSAGIPVASSYPKVSNSTIDIPMYVIHSKSDEIFPVKRIKARVKEYRKKGTKITYVQNKLSHYQACKYDIYLYKSINWLKNEVWTTKKPSTTTDGLDKDSLTQ